LEKGCAARMQTKYALGVLEMGPGDGVILPAWTWYSNYNTIVQVGALDCVLKAASPVTAYLHA
jgi:dTDP-4-amino-4,6-dideoxygalactose transaminase